MKPDILYPHRKLSRTGCVLSNSGKMWWLWCNLLRMSRVYRLSGNVKLQRRLDWQGYRFGCSIKKFHSPRSTPMVTIVYHIWWIFDGWSLDLSSIKDTPTIHQPPPPYNPFRHSQAYSHRYMCTVCTSVQDTLPTQKSKKGCRNLAICSCGVIFNLHRYDMLTNPWPIYFDNWSGEIPIFVILFAAF